ncbi:heat shock 70 kDa protein [Anoplophora glabripennis]|uniref:heat shock 70 kDa protein n=1 Tax=Anoplophora glabripennis TaxID=217634 RepID=UPI0008755FE7|nr:heat shock 70 kDa protein [Anoplophora glabripennis]
MSNAPAIGIDLGTTFSCASVYRRGRPELIPNAEGDRLTPSIVYFNPRTGVPSVGQIADELLTQCPKNGLLDAKRIIGRKYDDEFISRYTNSNEIHFSLVRGNDDQAAFEIEVSGETVIKKPEEVSAEVLKYLRRTACEYLGEDITKAVISVPAYFSNAQRKATKAAAELAGLTVLKLITEPTAAAVHYVSDKLRTNSNVLVFDFGGGTLDVSLIKVNRNVFEVRAVYGDTLLGGRNFDEALFEHFYKDFLDMNNDNFAGKKFRRRLSCMCANLKKKLSTNEEFTLFLDRYDGNSDLSIFMKRAKFEEINECIFQRALDVVKLCLEDSDLKKSDIDEVILVGGSTRIPKIRESLNDYFGSEKIKTDLNPDEAVAAGASIHAAFLLGDCQNLEKYRVTEVTPMSLGVNETGNLMNFCIPKNSRLPIEVSSNLVTSFNNQSIITFSIYEGERKNTIYNNKLGEFSITNIPKKRAGDVEFSVHFHLDEDGILTITAREKSTGRNNKLVVTMGQFRLSERKIKLSLEDARKHKIQDDVFENFVRCKQRLDKQCRHVLYDIEKISSESDKVFVKERCEGFLRDVNTLDFTEIEKLEAKFAVFNNSVSNILMKNCMLSLNY